MIPVGVTYKAETRKGGIRSASFLLLLFNHLLCFLFSWQCSNFHSAKGVVIKLEALLLLLPTLAILIGTIACVITVHRDVVVVVVVAVRITKPSLALLLREEKRGGKW